MVVYKALRAVTFQMKSRTIWRRRGPRQELSVTEPSHTLQAFKKFRTKSQRRQTFELFRLPTLLPFTNMGIGIYSYVTLKYKHLRSCTWAWVPEVVDGDLAGDPCILPHSCVNWMSISYPPTPLPLSVTFTFSTSSTSGSQDLKGIKSNSHQRKIRMTSRNVTMGEADQKTLWVYKFLKLPHDC